MNGLIVCALLCVLAAAYCNATRFKGINYIQERRPYRVHGQTRDGRPCTSPHGCNQILDHTREAVSETKNSKKTSQLYMFTIKLNMCGQSGKDLPSTIDKVKTLMGERPAAKCVHMFKVIGESKIVAVYEVTDVTVLERRISRLARLDNIEITSKPLIRYRNFASMLGVDDNLTKPTSNTIGDADQLFWLDFTIEYPGKSTDDLLAIWKREAEFALGARSAGLQVELYKVVAERKVHVFVVMSPEELDILSFNLPLIKENGNGVTIKNHAIQNLKDY